MKTATLRKQLLEDRFVLTVASIGITLISLSVIVPLLPVADPFVQDLVNRLAAPSWLGGEGGLLGTDELGRDLATRILYGLRTTFFIAAGAVLLGMIIGVVVGLSAGYLGGLWDSVAMRIADVQLSLPALMIVMTIIALLGGGALILVVVLGLNSWMLYARMVRSFVLRLRQSDFVASQEAIGSPARRVLFLHLLPNALPSIFAVASLELPRLMLGEATLSFLGFGVQPPTISLGIILSSGREYISSAWWVSTFSGLALAIAVLGTNVLSSWLQRQTDPLTTDED